MHSKYLRSKKEKKREIDGENNDERLMMTTTCKDFNNFFDQVCQNPKVPRTSMCLLKNTIFYTDIQ